jgi:hypothetical protein
MFPHPDTDELTAAVYLASYRATSFFHCIEQRHWLKLGQEMVEQVGLAFFDEEFQILAIPIISYSIKLHSTVLSKF